MLIGSLRLTGQYDARVVTSWIEDRRVDGILFGRCSKLELPLLTAAHAAKLPVALFVPDVAAKADIVVRCENARGGTLVGTHLIERGHRRIAFFGGPRSSRDTKHRLRGLQQAIEQDSRVSLVSVGFGSSYYPESGVEYAREFLATPKSKRPTGVVFGSDGLALGFAKAVLEAGICIPKDVAITGFDGSPEAGLFWPGLTTVEQPTRAMAEGACRALLSKIDGTTFDANQKYDVRLIERESSVSPNASRV
jgi:LacI family transcriptional regulator